MNRWAVIQHVPFEHPGLISTVAAEHGVELEVHRTYRGEPLPRPDELAGLVVLGGPMGAHDDSEHPHLAAERALLAAAVERELPVLGVCLGAQLLAAGLGAEVSRGPAFELGVGEVELVADDPVLGPAGSTLPVLHWHQDTFALPDGGVLLARSDRYAHQAFRVGKRAYGLQFHVEVDRDLAASFAPHLPEPVPLPEADRAAIEADGRRVLECFWRLAARPPSTGG